VKHQIDTSKHGPRAEAMTHPIESCVHCGFCLAACPTYAVLGEEMDSPRGRIYLMKSVLEENLAREDAQPFIDRCLGCMACVPACPSGVEYGDLLASYRAKTEAERSRPLMDSIARTMIKQTLPYPNRFRMAAKSGKLARGLSSALPDKIGAMLGMVPDRLPPDEPLQQVYAAKGERRARVALLSGCVQTVLAPGINSATVRVLVENGVEVVVPDGQGCCGSLMMHIGEDKQAMQLAHQNFAAFPDDVDAVITNAAGCGSGMKEYGLLFMGQPEEEQAHQFASRVMDISTFLDELGLVEPPELAQPLKVAYHDACHLVNAQGIAEAPRRLLGALGNVTVLEVLDGLKCCGSAGTYNLEQPELAGEIGQRKAQGIIDTGADVVASGNIGCLTQIETHLHRKGKPIPVMHTIELLDRAYSGASIS